MRSPVRLSRLELTPPQAAAFGLRLARLVETTGFHLRTADPALVVVTEAGHLRLLEHTAPNTVLGADGLRRVAWFSPEFVRGHEPSSQSDVFLVGLAVIGALTGRSPWQRESAYDTLRAVMEGRWAEPLRATRADVPGPLVNVLARAVLPRPELRTASLAALCHDLTPFASPGPEAAWLELVRGAFDGAEGLEPAPHHLTDEQARLVTADQLEEQGRHDEAQWLRLEAHVRHADERAREPLRAALEPLSARLGRAVVAGSARGPIERCPLVCGGQCPGAWEQLLLTPAPETRRCGDCGADVHYELTVAAAWQRVLDGQVVVVDASAPRTFGDLTPADDQIT